MLKRLLALSVIVATCITMFGIARAAEVVSPDNNGNIDLGPQASAKNSYVAGQNVNVDSSVGGDLVAAGNAIIVSGVVEDSLLAAGSTVTVRSDIGRHARLAGSTVVVSGHIKGDLLVAGSKVTINETAIIDGDLWLAGGSVTINGTVKGETKIVGDSVVLNGSFGSVVARVGSLTIGSAAKINGDLSYYAPKTASIDSQAKIAGQTNFTQTTQTSFRRLVPISGFSFLVWLGMLLLGWLLIAKWPKFTGRVVERISQHSWGIFGGLAILVIGPILSLMLLFTGVGTGWAVLLGSAWMFIATLGSLLGKIFLGSWIVKLVRREKVYTVDWRALLVGFIGLLVLRAIPFVGPFTSCLALLLGVYGLASVLWESVREH